MLVSLQAQEIYTTGNIPKVGHSLNITKLAN